MIKFKILTVFLILLINSCDDKQNENHQILSDGNWADSKDANVSFTTFKDGTIKYFEDDDIYNYFIEKDTLTIKEEGHIITKYKILKMTPDSLNLKTESGSYLKFYNRH